MWFFDPLTLFAMTLAYVVGYIALFTVALAVAPRVASKLEGKLSLHASMYLAMLIVIVSGFASIYLLGYILISATGFGYELLVALVIAVLVMNLFSYLTAPVLINAFYGARHDKYLQEVVNRVALRSGLKPPKAVVVEGPPNAFAFGNFLTGRYVAVSRSLLSMLKESELEAVIGHEIGHHKHRDTAVMLLMGIIPSVIYYLGLMLIRVGIVSGYARDERRSGSSPGAIALIAGIAAIIVSFIIQILILAFSRLREYYADAHGARVAGARSLQRALAKLHIYYYDSPEAEVVRTSKLRALFIYALAEAVANPLYSYYGGYRVLRIREEDVDRIIERLKREQVNPVAEILSTHPPIPKRLRFLDRLGVERIEA